MSIKRNAGFTLIELLIVIAILAILAAILFPVYARAKESSRRAACLGHIMQLGKGLRMYCEDWRGLAYPINYPYGCRDWDRADRMLKAFRLYIPYGSHAWQCPSDNYFGFRAKGWLKFPKSVSYAYQGYYGYNTMDNYREPWDLSGDPDLAVTGVPRNLDIDATDTMYRGQVGWVFCDMRVPENGWVQDGWTFTPHARVWWRANEGYIRDLTRTVLMADLHARTCKGWQRWGALKPGRPDGSNSPSDYDWNLP